MIEIVNRWTLAVLYKSENAKTVAGAVKEAYLQGGELRGAYLQGANLRGADLRGASLQGADLRGANLRGAYLRDANLQDANLRDANLQDVIGLLGEVVPLQISGTRDWIIVREEGHITIGCEHHPLGWWREHYQAIGRREHYTEEQIEEYRRHIEYCATWMAAKGVLDVAVKADA